MASPKFLARNEVPTHSGRPEGNRFGPRDWRKLTGEWAKQRGAVYWANMSGRRSRAKSSGKGR